MTHPSPQQVKQMCKRQFRKQAVTLKKKKPLSMQRKLLLGQRDRSSCAKKEI